MVSATVYAVGNVASSVALVLVNKKVFAGGFAFPMTLSFFHFVFTVGWYQLLAMCGAYSPPSTPSGLRARAPSWRRRTPSRPSAGS